MASLHRSRPTHLPLGLALVSLLVGIFYVGATLPSEEPRLLEEEATPGQEPPSLHDPGCYLSTLEEYIPPRVEQLCSIARGVAERIPIGTIALLEYSRDGVTVAEARVVARDFRCSLEGLHAALIIKPVIRKRPPVVSSYDFVDRWVAGVEAWGVDTLAEPAIRGLTVGWDEGQDAGGVPLVRLAGEWEYVAWNGGVRGNVAYGAETLPRSLLTDPPSIQLLRWRSQP
jgi:hypothetical protein